MIFNEKFVFPSFHLGENSENGVVSRLTIMPDAENKPKRARVRACLQVCVIYARVHVFGL